MININLLKEKKEGNGKRPRVRQPNIPRGNTLKEIEEAKLNQRKGKLPVPNVRKLSRSISTSTNSAS